MAKDKIQIIQINTDPAKKSLKDLRKELKDLKDEMVNLEEGSDAFLEVAQKAGTVKHQIDEISESVKGASSDFGDMVGNISNVAAGMVGAFSAVSGGLQALGVENKAIDESIKKMQGLMAVVQGLSQIDKAIKSMDKLRNSITSTTGAAKLLKAALEPKVFLAISAAIAGITFVFQRWKKQEEEVHAAIKKRREELEKIKMDKIIADHKRYNDELQRTLTIEDAYYEGFYKDDKEKQLEKKIAARQRVLNGLMLTTPEGMNKLIADYEEELAKYEEGSQKWYEILIEITHLEAEIENFNRKGDAEKEALLNTYKLHTEKLENLKTELAVLQEFKKGEKAAAAEADRIAAERKAKYSVPLNSTVVPLEVQPLPTETLEEMGERMGRILADAEIKRRNQEWKDNIANIEEAGNMFFEGLQETMGAFSDSTLGLSSGWIASLDQFQLAFQQTMDIVKNEGTVGWEAYGNVAATALGGIGTMLNALSQEQDVSTKEGFEKQKKLQIGATVMNMLSGIMAAWTSSMALPAPASFILGAIQTAATAALGAAQIAKIKSQTMDSAIASGAINPSRAAIQNSIVPPVQYSQAVQGAQINGNISSQKVYVTESDITDTIQRVSVQQSENTY